MSRDPDSAVNRPWPSNGSPEPRSTAGGLVTAVLCAAFDSVTDDAVLAVRDELIRAGVRLPARPRHRPHLTLAALRVHPDQLPAVVAATADLAAGPGAIELPLTQVGTFNRAGALWLGPSERHGSSTLRALQRSMLTLTVDGGWEAAFSGRTRTEDWVPHCSLATRLPVPRLLELQALVVRDFEPIDAVVAGVAVIVVGGAGDAGLVPLSRPAYGRRAR